MKPISEIRLGKWQDKCQDIESIDHVITDAPYSEKTHLGSRSSLDLDNGFINYEFITESLVKEFVNFWAPKVNHWFIVFGDDMSSKWWKYHLELAGMYVFAPVYYIKTNPTPRLNADGPTSSGEIITRAVSEKKLVEMAASVLDDYDPRLFQLTQDDESVITIARMRDAVRNKKSRPGHYLARSQTHDSRVTGQKDFRTCCEIIKDYCEPSDFVIDPFAGYCTIPKACQFMGVNSIGCEIREHIWVQGKMRMREQLNQVDLA